MNVQGGLANLSTLRGGRKAGRVSSWDHEGRNTDWHGIRPGETYVLADLQGLGQLPEALAAAAPRQARIHPDGPAPADVYLGLCGDRLALVP